MRWLGRCLWDFSETYNLPLGPLAPYVFGMSIGSWPRKAWHASGGLALSAEELKSPLISQETYSMRIPWMRQVSLFIMLWLLARLWNPPCCSLKWNRGMDDELLFNSQGSYSFPCSCQLIACRWFSASLPRGIFHLIPRSATIHKSTALDKVTV